MHYPEDETGKKELEKYVSDVHAQLAIEYINKLSCPLEQKLEIIEEIKKIYETKKALL